MKKVIVNDLYSIDFIINDLKNSIDQEDLFLSLQLLYSKYQSNNTKREYSKNFLEEINNNNLNNEEINNNIKKNNKCVHFTTISQIYYYNKIKKVNYLDYFKIKNYFNFKII
jgi:hypothetical protein